MPLQQSAGAVAVVAAIFVATSWWYSKVRERRRAPACDAQPPPSKDGEAVVAPRRSEEGPDEDPSPSVVTPDKEAAPTKSKRLRIVVLNHRDGSEYNDSVVSMLRELFAMCGADVDLVEADPLDGCVDARADGYVVPGSRLSARSEGDYVDSMRDISRALHGGGVKTLGLCFGHRIIAQALGGRLADHNKGFRAGAETFRCGQLAALVGSEDGVSMLYAHDEVVMRLPAGGQALTHHEAPFVYAAAYWKDRRGGLAWRGGNHSVEPHVITLAARPELCTRELPDGTASLTTGLGVVARLIEEASEGPRGKGQEWREQRLWTIATKDVREDTVRATASVLRILWPAAFATERGGGHS